MRAIPETRDAKGSALEAVLGWQLHCHPLELPKTPGWQYNCHPNKQAAEDA
jgi:hypothetical protein